MAAVTPAYGQVQDQEAGDPPSSAISEVWNAGKAKYLAILAFILVVTSISEVISYALTNYQCDPSAPPSQYGLHYLPRDVTLDETAAGAFDSLRGRSVNVFAGKSRKDRAVGEPIIGSFVKVWTWMGSRFGYLERTADGDHLRFTASQTWTWLHSPIVLTPCDSGQSYEIARVGSLFGSFDGTFHNIWLQKQGGNEQLATADHTQEGLDVGASLFSGVNLQVKWSVVFKSVDTKTAGGIPVVLAMAYQWYNHDLIANFGASNWEVSSKNSSSLPSGVKPLPAHVVAYTSALYDLQTGSDRRRRSSSGRSRHR